MNGQPAQSSQFGVSFSRSAEATVAALRAAARTLLAHVRETLAREPYPGEDVAGMNAHMLRDIGADASISSRPSGPPDLQYPRL